MHILVVEDERILCETIARSLKRLAYSVDCCYDGITAMQMLADDNFDLVVLDLNLPDADGMTVLRTLRKTDRDTKVLILSARSEVSDKVDGLDAGANDYLAKPFHLEELAARIRSLTPVSYTHLKQKNTHLFQVNALSKFHYFVVCDAYSETLACLLKCNCLQLYFHVGMGT